MRRLLLLMLGVVVLACTQILAQRTLAGKVQDDNGRPVVGASVNFTIRETQPPVQAAGVPAPSYDVQAINPNDFESITILKDAGTGALCPVSGGKNVMIITPNLMQTSKNLMQTSKNLFFDPC